MLGTVGEYIVESTNTEDNIVELIEQQQLDLGFEFLPQPFLLKKLGIKSDSTCELLINKNVFVISENEPLEIGYNLMDVYNIKSNTAGIRLIIRYLYWLLMFDIVRFNY